MITRREEGEANGGEKGREKKVSMQCKASMKESRTMGQLECIPDSLSYPLSAASCAGVSPLLSFVLTRVPPISLSISHRAVKT